MARQRTVLPPQFIAKKQAILSQLALDPKDYEDKSPKGSVDIQILELLRLINDVDGWVTTSSCSGRVAVFVEGPKKAVTDQSSASPPGGRSTDNLASGDSKQNPSSTSPQPAATQERVTKTAPGGKGGGHWLYVSHDPLSRPTSPTDTASEHWTTTFNISSPQDTHGHGHGSQNPRLIHLSFSPLILHILCATLQHARPLLSAAINAGFRESGVQSLKALDPAHAGDGAMVAIRTNGIVFETIVGRWDEEAEQAVALVDEPYLRMCAAVVNERFRWNGERTERLVRELRLAVRREGWCAEGEGEGGGEKAETKDERRERKRKEGLERQRMMARTDGDGDGDGGLQVDGNSSIEGLTTP